MCVQGRVYVYMYAHRHVHDCHTYGSQKRAPDLPSAGVWVTVSHPAWALGTEPGSFAKTALALLFSNIIYLLILWECPSCTPVPLISQPFHVYPHKREEEN